MKNSKLRKWRLKHNMTVQEAANYFKFSIGHYSEIERGIKQPSLQRALFIKEKTNGYVNPEDHKRAA